MSFADDLSTGKGRHDENFPVASLLIAPERRDVVIKFYAVARLADDIADHPSAPAAEKLARLAAVEASLEGANDEVAAAVALRQALGERGLGTRHMLDLLEAFKRDVTKSRYADWDELMDYCRYSAAPVGRFLLELHGEPDENWSASDALCAALQVINHLQDCGSDFKSLDRVYVPLDALHAAGLVVADLGADRASDALRGVITRLAQRTRSLLATAAPLAHRTRDNRLALEISVIQQLALSLARRLERSDPLSERVHHRRSEVFGLAMVGVASGVGGRVLGLARGSR
jgi:squalene synthase HpnC